MTRASITVAIMAGVAWFSVPIPSRAQIATYVDDHGKLVYINGDSPVRRSGSTISSPTADSRPRSAASTASLAPELDGSVSGPAMPVDDRLDRIVRQAAERHKVDPALVKAVISTESSWNPRAISRKGAVGLMQLVPQTAQRYGVNNSFDPAQNVEGGTMYLRSLLDRYNGDLNKSLAAYNAGEGAVDRSGGVPGIPETQRYVQRVTDAYFRPSSGRDTSLWSSPRAQVRKEVDSNGRVIFTNE